MRVLVVTNMWPTDRVPHSGGHVRQLVQGLAEIGVEIEVFFFDRLLNGRSVYWNAGPKVRGKLESCACDLVHVAYGGVMAACVTNSVRHRPVVVSLCGSDLYGENFSGAVQKVSSMCGIFASRRAARRAAGVIVKSKRLLAALPLDVDRRKVRVMPNGVDLRCFRPLDRDTCRSRLGWQPDAFHVLFPTNMSDPVKRPELAQAAVEDLKSDGIPAQLHRLAGVVHRDVPVWLNAADAVLITSAHEGSPNIVKEALACNRPVVSVDVGDVAERIAGVQGCYLAAAEPQVLADRLSRVYRGPGAVQGRAAVEALALERVSFGLLRFYQDAIDRSCDANRPAPLPKQICRRPMDSEVNLTRAWYALPDMVRIPQRAMRREPACPDCAS